MSTISRARRAAIAVCALLLAFSLFAAEQPPNASGTLKVNGYTTNLHHAYAFHDAEDNSTRVLITSKPVSAANLAAEASGESSGEGPSLRALVKQGQISAIELDVKPDNQVETVTVYDKRFDMPTPTTGHKFWYEPYRMTGSWTGARSRTKEQQSFFKTTWEYDVAFFAPVGQKTFEVAPAAEISSRRKDIDARETPRIVPAGGGEEGAAYLAYRKNLDARDGKALLAQMTPSMQSAVAADMHAAKLTDSALGSWAFMQSMPPGKIEVVGGTRDPEGTLLELRKTVSPDQQLFGTAKMVKDHGAWRISEEKW